MSLPKPSKTPVVLSWSSGKDSAWALHLLREGGEYEVVALITTVDGASGCVPVHGTRPEVLAAQAETIGLPLVTVPLDWPCANAEYEKALTSSLERCRRDYGVRHIAFGDLFLEDIRAYRVGLCERIGWQPVFPLWGTDTTDLAITMYQRGLVAVISAVNTHFLDGDYAGRMFDYAWFADVQDDADVCGENGEFHTIVMDAPEFRRPVRLQTEGIHQVGDLSTIDLGLWL